MLAAAAEPPSTFVSFLIGAGGIGLMLAIGAFEKWRRRRGYAFGEHETKHPASDAIAATLARAAYPLDTSVQMFRDENDAPGIVAFIRGLDPALALRTTGRTTGDVEVGHVAFDDRFRVQGATALVRARLDGPTRDTLLTLVRRLLRDSPLTVADGQLRAVVPEAYRVADGETADETFTLLAQVARRLSGPVDIVAELAKSARQDALSRVRVLCVRTLVREYAQDAGLGPLLRDAAADPDPEVRFEAATALGPDGLAVLNALVADTSVEDELAARAAESLGPKLDLELARATLRRESGRPVANRRASVARACAAALGRAGDPQDEALLLEVVKDQHDDALRLSAVRALGQAGTALAVPTLTELTNASEGLLRRAAREAIATIQSRLQGATPGQLSLDPGTGQMALTDESTGRISEAGTQRALKTVTTT
jgi:hypothetical protein